MEGKSCIASKAPHAFYYVTKMGQKEKNLIQLPSFFIMSKGKGLKNLWIKKRKKAKKWIFYPEFGAKKFISEPASPFFP